MSYHVRFEVNWEGDGFDPRSKKARERVLAAVEEYLRADNTEYDADSWIEEFRNAFLGKEAQIGYLSEEWAIGLLKSVSGGLPGVTFEARGAGEELEDVWAFRCLDGEVVWEGSLDGDRAGVVRETIPVSAWPRPLDVSRVVCQPGLRKFIAEILADQSPAAQVAALTIKALNVRKARALVYVGPLEQGGYERIRDLIDDRYRVQQFRDLRRLTKDPTATADDPSGY